MIVQFILFILLNFASHLANEDNFNSKLIFLKFIFRFRIRIYQSKKTDPNPDPQKKTRIPNPNRGVSFANPCSKWPFCCNYPQCTYSQVGRYIPFIRALQYCTLHSELCCSQGSFWKRGWIRTQAINPPHAARNIVAKITQGNVRLSIQWQSQRSLHKSYRHPT